MANTTTSLSAAVSTFYDKKFLERFRAMLRFGIAAYSRRIPANEGKTIVFNRMGEPVLATTPLTEAVTPVAINLSTTAITAVVAIYGAVTQTSEFYEETSIDEGLKEQVSVMAQNGAETVNQVIRRVVTTFQVTPGTTIQRAGAAADDASITAADVVGGQEIRRAVRTLKQNKAMAFDDGYFKSIIPVEAAYDLRGSSEWLDAYRYVDPLYIQNGEIGRLHGVRFWETNDRTVTAGGTFSALQNFVPSGTAVPNAAFSLTGAGATVTDLYETFVFGYQCYGCVEVEGADAGKEPIVIYKKPDAGDTSNPLNLFSTIGWKVKFVAVSLNALWGVGIRSAAGA